MVVSKDVLWYVLDDLKGYIAKLASSSSRWVYIGQSFPDQKPFLGMNILSDGQALLKFIEAQGYDLTYCLIEQDSDVGGREYVHALFEVKK